MDSWVAVIHVLPQEPSIATKARNCRALTKVRAEGNVPSSRAFCSRRGVGCSVFWLLSAISANQQSFRGGKSGGYPALQQSRHQHQSPAKDRDRQQHLHWEGDGEQLQLSVDPPQQCE